MMKQAKLIWTGCLLAFLSLCLAVPGWTNELNGVDESTLLSFRRSLGIAAEQGSVGSSAQVPTERGVSAMDDIRGNGTPLGYGLSHGGVIPNSEWVSVNGSIRTRNKGYYINYESGSLTFTEPIKAHQIIHITYRYSPQGDANRTAVAAPLLALHFGNTSAGIMFANSVAGSNQAYDLSTYGLNLTTKLGAKSTMTNMMYMSTARESGRVSLTGQKSSEQKEAPKSDQMFLHNSKLQIGQGTTLEINYQDIGKDFSGFTAMRQQKAAPDAILNQLEKEKDIRRMGFNVGSDTAKLGWSRISDTGGEITRQSFNIGNDSLKLSMSTQKIDKDFSRFKDLAEAERAQWEKERGMKRSNIELGFAPTKGADGSKSWSMLSMNSIDDTNGKVTNRMLNYAGKGFALSMADSKIDKEFNRLADLSEADRAKMNLQIYQLFDPNAASANPTDKERAHLATQTGIERKNAFGKFNFGDTQTMLQFVTVGDETGKVDRQKLSVSGKGYSFTGLIQDIDKDFNRLSTLSPIEQQNFGNESGMHRMNLNADIASFAGMQVGTYFSRVNAEDAGISKYGMALKGGNFNLAANFRKIDPDFTRIQDLADSEKQKMAAEIGMRVYDLTSHYQASKQIAIDSFIYNGKHAVEDRFRRQLQNNISYNASNGMQIGMFRNQISSGSSDAVSKYMHQTLTLNHRIGTTSFKMLQNEVKNESQDGQAQTEKTQMLHFDTDPAKKISLIGDWKKRDTNLGKFEHSQSLKMNSRLSHTLAFTGMKSTIKTDESKIEAQEFSLTGKFISGTNLAARFGEKMVNGATIGKTRELSLSPEGAKDYWMFKQVNWNVRFGQSKVAAGKVETETKGAKVETLLMNHKVSAEYSGLQTKEGQTPIVRTFGIASNPDPKARIHYDFAYKVRDSLGGSAPKLLIRRYNADWQMDDTTKLTYNYSSYNEKPDGKIEPIGTECIRLAKAFVSGFTVIGQWELANNYEQDYTKSTLSLGLAGKISKKALFEASYGFDHVTTPSWKSEARTYKLKYDYQINAENFISFSGSCTDWDGQRLTDPNVNDILIQLDYRTLFD